MDTTQPLPAVPRFFSPEFVRDPYPTYRRYLETGRIHAMDFRPGVYAVFSHADCSEFVRDARLTAKRAQLVAANFAPEQQSELSELVRRIGQWMLFMDAPEHARLRKLMNKGFSPAIIDAMRPKIEALVERLIEPLRGAGQFDLINDFAYPLPVRVIAGLLGVPDEFHQRFIAWSDAIAVCFGNPMRTLEDARSAQQAIVSLTGYFKESVAHRRKHRTDDLVSLMINIEESGDVLTEEEVYAQCVMLLFGGHETTRNLIGNGIYALLRHPQAMEELIESPQIIRTAVEELLRYDSPIQFTSRTVKTDMEIGNVRLAAGNSLMMILGAANRDPEAFERPDVLDLERPRNAQLSFGAGSHFCVGQQLARLEGQIAIRELTRVFPTMRLAEEEPSWAPNMGFRGLRSLRVAI